MLDADYSQIEYRTLVAMAKEPELAKLFQDPDTDYHTLMASRMYGVPYEEVTPSMRSDAKSFNFGIPYGMGFKSLAMLLSGGLSGPAQIEEAKEKYEMYFKDQPNVRQFFGQVKEMAQINKYTKTFWKRYRYYSFEASNGKKSEAKKAAALRQAGNAVIQGTAADIFKISVARNFMWIRRNNIYGDVLITNMIHDEQLMEINCDNINVRRAVGDIVQNMEFKVDGFPPLYVGAGIGSCWKNAKGKMAEMHPNMVAQLISESKQENEPLRAEVPTSNKAVLEYFDNRVYEFRVNKIREYVENPENWGKTLHPVIGALIEQQFTYGLEKEISGKELGRAALARFIEVNHVNSSVEHFIVEDVQKDVEEEISYDDDNEMDIDDMLEDDTPESTFTMIDESDKFFGVSVQDIIKTFGLLVSTEQKICGIDVSRINVRKRDELVNLIMEYQVDEGEPDSMQVVFLQPGNVLFRTAVWVKGLKDKDIKTRLGIA